MLLHLLIIQHIIQQSHTIFSYVSLFLPFSLSYDFTPLDSSAVYVLSSMARQRRTSLSSGGAVSPDCDKLERSSSPQSSSSKSNRSHTSGTASGATPTKCKRPMNAFMLFAKKYRVEYTQMYPGKDNRYWGYIWQLFCKADVCNFSYNFCLIFRLITLAVHLMKLPDWPVETLLHCVHMSVLILALHFCF